MSYTTVYAIDMEGWVKEVGEAHCAPAFFPVVWMRLGAKYGVEPEFSPPTSADRPYYGERTIRNVWALHKDPRLTAREKLLLNIAVTETLRRIAIAVRALAKE